MKTYEILYSQDSTLKKHLLQCHSKQEAIAYCKAHHLRIIRITPLQTTPKLHLTHASIPPKELILFFYQFAIMLDSGISLYELLKNASSHAYSPKITAMIHTLLQKIQEGNTLHESLQPYQKDIGTLGMALIELGEKTGNLSTACKLYVNHLKSKEENKTKIKNALIYPSFLILAILLALVLIMGYLLPQFQMLFTQSDKELPLITEWLFTLSAFCTLHNMAMIFIACVMIALILFLGRQPLKKPLDTLSLKIPLLGRILQLHQLFFYFSTLKLLLSMGFGLDSTLTLCQETLTNHALKDRLSLVLAHLKQGDSLHISLQKTQVFEPIVLELIRVAEVSGEMDKMLETLITLYHEELTQKQTQLLVLIEPAITLFMAIFVLILALGIFLPLWDFSSSAML